jgi:hypothetical protein
MPICQDLYEKSYKIACNNRSTADFIRKTAQIFRAPSKTPPLQFFDTLDTPSDMP